MTRRKAEASGGAGFGPQAGWWLAGGLGLVILAVVGFLAFSDSGSDPPAPPSATGTAPQVDLGSMTPREAADRLFNRVMQALADRDTAEAMDFLPMAMQAYEMARPLDDDGLFHLALLQRSAGDPDAARTTALEALNQNPDHLLNLWAAAETARTVGDPAAAEEHYRHLLDVWDRELAEQRPEYEEHGTLMPLIREDAEWFLSGAAS